MAVGVKVDKVFHTFADYNMPICYILKCAEAIYCRYRRSWAGAAGGTGLGGGFDGASQR